MISANKTDTPLNIGYVMQNGAPDLSTVSGPQLHTVAVIENLMKLGHKVRTIAIQNRKIVWSDNLRHWVPVEYEYCRRPLFRFLESSLRRLQTELKLPFIGIFDSLRFSDACVQQLNEIDLIYERHGYMGYGGLLAARRLGVPHILELNGNMVKEIDEMDVPMSTLQRKVGRQVSKYNFLGVNKIVVVSEALKDELIFALKIPKDKISVVLNGANVELFSRCYDEENVRRIFNISTKPIVAFIGSFQPWHGVDLLVNAFAEVKQTIPDSQLLLIGDGSNRRKIKSQIAVLNLESDVILMGRLIQEDVAAVLSIADVVVAPYPFEHSDIVGTPLKLLEYLAAGKAIVASSAPIHEIIKDGITGLRVAPANKQKLAKGILTVLNDEGLRKSLSENAAKEAHKHSWEQVVEKLCSIFYSELAK